MTRLTLLFAALLLQGPAALAHHTGREVMATVYHQEFNGEPLFCGGAPYRHWGVSAAHPWLPCGTRVRVSHGGRSLVVPITDRCDCNSLDLSAGAAWRLGVPLDGVATVKISY